MEDADVAADDLGLAKAGQQIIGVQGIRAAPQAIAEMGAGLDFVAQRAQAFDMMAQRVPAEVDLLSEIGSGDGALPGGSQGAQNL